VSDFQSIGGAAIKTFWAHSFTPVKVLEDTKTKNWNNYNNKMAHHR